MYSLPFVRHFLVTAVLLTRFAKASETSDITASYSRALAIVREELQKFTETDLLREAKLSGSWSKGGSLTVHGATGGKKNEGKELFTWNSPSGSLPDIIVIGSRDNLTISSTNANVQTNPSDHWMSGTFLALRKQTNKNDDNRGSNNRISFFALVSYVREELEGLSVEWDRWSPKILRRLSQKDTEAVAQNDFPVDTMFCSYGTCPCLACKCGANKTKADRGNSTGKFFTSKAKKRIPAPRVNRKGQHSATSKAHSKKGNTYTSAITKGTKGDARASSTADNGTAVSESAAKGGESSAFSKGEKTAVAEAQSETGGAKSAALAKGLAQSQAQSRGGGVEATAAKNKEEGADDDDDDESDLEDDYDDDDDIEHPHDMDESSIITDTDKIFTEVHERAEIAKNQTRGTGLSIKDICANEQEIDAVIIQREVETISKGDKSKIDAVNKSAISKNPVNYGIDVELGVNSSVLIAIKYSGVAPDPTHCCRHPPPRRSVVLDFLAGIKQECNIALEKQLERLEHSMFGMFDPMKFGFFGSPSATPSNQPQPFSMNLNPFFMGQNQNSKQGGSLASSLMPGFMRGGGNSGRSRSKRSVLEVLQSKKLSAEQNRDLIAMIFLLMYKKPETAHGINAVKNITGGTSSPEVNLMTSIIVHSVHFALTEGRNHKVKILKGLEKNVRAMWAGMLLEVRVCISGEKVCDPDHLEKKLIGERRVVLGLYQFLRFAEARVLAIQQAAGHESIMQVFVSFMELHSSSMTSLSYCKSKRVITNVLKATNGTSSASPSTQI